MHRTTYFKTAMLFSGWCIPLLWLTAAIAQTAPIVMPERGLCAHRGCPDTHPENTLPAFRQAIALGAQMIEFDIQITKDSFLVIMHDQTVDRTTNGKGKVLELTLAEIKRLDAGMKKDPSFAGTPVPTLEETLALMPRNVWLNCHVKGGAHAGKATAEAIRKAQRVHQAFITCGEEAAAAAREATPGIRICNAESRYRKDTPQYVSAAVQQKAGFIQLLRDGDNRSDLLLTLKQNGVKINYYYAQSPQELAPLLNAGVDFVLVNSLSDFLPEARKLGIQPVQPLF